MKRIGILLITLFAVNNLSFAYVVSWRYKHESSLFLTDVRGLIESNYSMMPDPDTTTHYLRIEDVVAPEGNDFEQLFVGFTKIRFSSHIVVKIYDTFTDEQLAEITFYEKGLKSLGKYGALSDRVYLVVELYGKDVELRSVGFNINKSIILEEEEFRISDSRIYAKKDNLHISLSLSEEAEVSLYLYTGEGGLEERILSKEVLGVGDYEFQWDPLESDDIPTEGSPYYVWIRAINLRSSPVEYIREFYLIP